MADDQDKLSEILAEALAQPSPEACERYLGEACGQDNELRDQVNSLLKAHHGAGNFLRQSVVMPGGNGASSAEGPGTMIGRYKLLQQIGEGGFGVVFMAEQQEPVRRIVALKVIKAGMDTREVVARFEAERQALALMDHPNIARVLDGGTTASGRPYFVMDLVKGVPLTEFCEQHQLPIEARLRLFVKVCAGVQHAHQKGVIHRDLKPTNVLVTLHDGEPVPKVIDFGIAKAIGQKLTERTLFTRFEQLIGTPAYMSPEQAEWSGLDVDTRSDLYSLGVLLYELLTGTTPLRKETLARAALDEVRRMIREAEPPKPSTRLTALMSAGNRLSPPAGTRKDGPQQETPAILSDSASMRRRLQAVRGDLDWIVMKALEKDRTRRYETVNGLARDLERHLDGEPVVACPPSKLYRFRKLVRRHRLAITAASAVAAALVIGLGISTWMFLQERSAKQEQTRLRLQSEANERKAQDAAAKAQQIARFLKDMLQSVGPSVALGRDTRLLREVLDKAAKRVGEDLKNEPLVKADVQSTLGGVYYDMGEYQQAEAMARQVLALQQNQPGNVHPDVFESLNNLAQVLEREGKLDEAEDTDRQALAMARKSWGDENEHVSDSLNNLGEALHARGKLAEAETVHRQGLAMLRKLPGSSPAAIANSMHNLAGVLLDEGDLGEAESLTRQALELQRKLVGNDHPDVASSLHQVALILRAQGKLAEATEVERQVLAMARKFWGPDHEYIAASLGDLDVMLTEQGEWAEGEALEAEALAMRRKLWGNEHPDIAFSLDNLGMARRDQGKLAEAESFLREAVAMRKKLLGNEHPSVARSLLHLASVLEKEGRLEEAESLCREALATNRSVFAGQPANWEADIDCLAGICLARHEEGEIEKLFNELLTPALQSQPEAASLFRNRARFLARRSRWKEAAEDAQKALAFKPNDVNAGHLLILLRAAEGDAEGCREASQQALARFTATNEPVAAAQMALDCLLFSPGGAHLDLAAELAGRALTLGTNNHFLPQFEFCEGLAEYREGHFASAADWSARLLATNEPSANERLQPQAGLVLAMARWQLQQSNEARAALTQGIHLAQTNSPRSDANDLGSEWPDWVVAQVLLREANQLIGSE